MVSISSFCLMHDLFSWSESSSPLPQSLGNLQNSLSLYFASSPQVAGVPRFRFGPPEDMPQTSSSHSDLGQLASQGGKAVLGSLFHGPLGEKEIIQSTKHNSASESC